MEVNLNKLGEQEIESTNTAKRMRLSEGHESIVFQMFTKLIYSNPIGTVVREITSNCFDSHVEAKVNAPVRIKKWQNKEDGTHYISFFDYGVGMSPDRIDNIYGVYFNSSKRADNTQIGGFGIGGKTPLAYKRKYGLGENEYDNSFHIITRFEGIEYTYLVFEGKEAPEISDPTMVETTEGNGTEIRIPVLERDCENFAKEMVRQLYYFENIIFEGFEESYRYNSTLTNEYQIVRGKSFFFRGNEYSEYMHICLGRVAYPIDYNVLGLSSSDYRLPIAVKIEIGEIGVNLSREQLDYSEGTIKLLKKRLEETKAEIKELIAKQYSNVQSLEDYFNVKGNFGRLEFPNGSSINVGNLIKQSDVDFSNFRYQFMKMPNDKQLFRFFFDTKSYGKKPKRSRYSSSSYEFEGSYEAVQRNSNLLYVDGEFNRKVVKQAYLKSIHELYHIVELRNIADNSMRQEISELFNVHLDKTVDDNGKPLPYVQSLIDMQEEYFSIVQKNAKDYDALVVPDDFVVARKNKNVMSKEMRNTTIPVKFIGGYRSKSRVKLEKLINYNSYIWYGTAEEEGNLRQIKNIYEAIFAKANVITSYDTYYNTFDVRHGKADKVSSMMFIVVAEGNVKYMQYCKKAHKAEDFFRKVLYRKEDMVMTYFQTYGLMEKYREIDSLYKEERFKEVSAKWAQKVANLEAIVNSIPEKGRDGSIGNVKFELEKYFDLNNVKMTAEQRKIGKQIDEILTLQANNEKILKYIDMPYRFKEADPELIEILKKVMAL
jgi:hypothetical protein